MKNKKGFTLIELLAVLTLLAIIMIIAVPNVISIIEKNRKDTMLNDAKRLISATQYKAATLPATYLPTSTSTPITKTLTDLWAAGIKDLETDPDNSTYVGSSSYVKIVLDSNNNYVYYIKLCGSKRHINETVESNLTSISVVLDGAC